MLFGGYIIFLGLYYRMFYGENVYSISWHNKKWLYLKGRNQINTDVILYNKYF